MDFIRRSIQLFVVVLFLVPYPTGAEYRAFSLYIQNEEAGSERRVVSTLDELQYPGYYPLYQGETITRENTWRCKGNTSNFKPICPPPAE